MDLLAANALARAFYGDVYDMPGQPPNIARFTFLDDRAHEFYPDWDMFADVTVAILRTEAGRDPHNKELHDLIGELSTRSTEFRSRWGAHNVRHHGTGIKTFHHRVVGDVTLAYEGLDMAAEPGLTLTIYAPNPDRHPRNGCGYSPRGPPPTTNGHRRTPATNHNTHSAGRPVPSDWLPSAIAFSTDVA